MNQLFHGWRRKTGCVTLVMAIALMAVWIRSCIVIDAVKFSPSPHESLHYLVSADGKFQWRRREIIGGYPAASWRTESLASRPDVNLYADTNDGRSWTASYWHIVIPLSLLSAYLILWKPRKAK